MRTGYVDRLIGPAQPPEDQKPIGCRIALSQNLRKDYFLPFPPLLAEEDNAREFLEPPTVRTPNSKKRVQPSRSAHVVELPLSRLQS